MQSVIPDLFDENNAPYTTAAIQQHLLAPTKVSQEQIAWAEKYIHRMKAEYSRLVQDKFVDDLYPWALATNDLDCILDILLNPQVHELKEESADIVNNALSTAEQFEQIQQETVNDQVVPGIDKETIIVENDRTVVRGELFPSIIFTHLSPESIKNWINSHTDAATLLSMRGVSCIIIDPEIDKWGKQMIGNYLNAMRTKESTRRRQLVDKKFPDKTDEEINKTLPNFLNPNLRIMNLVLHKWDLSDDEKTEAFKDWNSVYSTPVDRLVTKDIINFIEHEVEPDEESDLSGYEINRLNLSDLVKMAKEEADLHAAETQIYDK